MPGVPHVPGSHTIKYDAPPHRCPVCNHSCSYTRPKDRDPDQLGRPAKTQMKLVKILRARGEYVPGSELARLLEVNPKSLLTVVYRTRANGARIVYAHGQGYKYLGSEDPHAEDAV